MNENDNAKAEPTTAYYVPILKCSVSLIILVMLLNIPSIGAYSGGKTGSSSVVVGAMAVLEELPPL